MKILQRFVLVISLLVPFSAQAELLWEFTLHTRYMALGDSLTAGYGAVPATEGYVYLLYRSGVFDAVPGTILSNAGVPSATTQHVLHHQVPQAIEAFQPDVITLSVGGNDILRILSGADPNQVLLEFASNLTQILGQLRASLPSARIYISNFYTIAEIPGADFAVPVFNSVLATVASAYDVPVADVYSAFQGKQGLLLIKRHGADQLEVHPTNAGHRAIAAAFKAVIE